MLSLDAIFELPAGDVVLEIEQLLAREGALPILERRDVNLRDDAEKVADEGIVKYLRGAGSAEAFHQDDPADERGGRAVLELGPVLRGFGNRHGIEQGQEQEDSAGRGVAHLVGSDRRRGCCLSLGVQPFAGTFQKRQETLRVGRSQQLKQGHSVAVRQCRDDR